MAAVIDAEAALTQDADGNDVWVKNPDDLHRPASTIKTMTFYVARQWVTDAMLQDEVTVTSDDVNTTGTEAFLQAGDVVTWEALFYALMLPSGNDAARCIARVVGDMIADDEGGTGGMSRFVERMGEIGTDVFGWTDPAPTFATSAGFPDDDSRMTARQLCELMRACDQEDPYIITVAATESYQIVAGGPNARSWTVNHTVSKDDFPEMIAAKSGIQSAAFVANTQVLWEYDGQRFTTTILKSWPGDQRYVDLRAVMDDVIASLPGPPPDPSAFNAWFHVGGQLHAVQAAFIYRGGVARPLSEIAFRP